MSEEIEAYRHRVEAARRALASLGERGWAGAGELGPTDAETGERWDRGNVLGHLAEMLPYWTTQLRAIVEEGGTEVGRDEIGYVQRREGIEAGRQVGPAELLNRIDGALEGVLALLGGLRADDLDRRVTFHAPRVPARELDLRLALEQLVVGHVEAHLDQLRELA